MSFDLFMSGLSPAVQKVAGLERASLPSDFTEDRLWLLIIPAHDAPRLEQYPNEQALVDAWKPLVNSSNFVFGFYGRKIVFDPGGPDRRFPRLVMPNGHIHPLYTQDQEITDSTSGWAGDPDDEYPERAPEQFQPLGEVDNDPVLPVEQAAEPEGWDEEEAPEDDFEPATDADDDDGEDA